MSWTPLGNCGEAGMAGFLPDSGEAGLSGNRHYLDITITDELTVGTVVLCRATTAYGGLGNGTTTRHHRIIDASGNTWTKVYEYGRGEFIDFGAFDGRIVSLWRCQLTAALHVDDTIRLMVEFNARLTAAATLNAFDIGGSGFALTELGAEGAQSQTGDPAVTLLLGAPADVIWVGAAAYDGDDTLTETLDADFTTDRSPYSPAAGTTVLWGQFRESTTDTETWECGLSADRPWTAVLAAFSTGVFVPPVTGTPTPGPREFQRDFESPLFGVSGTSTTRRPDAVSLDYLTPNAIGPTDIEDLGDGLTARAWRIHAAPWVDDPVNFQEVTLQRADDDNYAWEPATVVFYVPAPFGVEFACCFDELGRLVLACERPTGSGGAPEVWLRWYDVDAGTPPGSDPDYVFINLGAGRTPRVILDRFPLVGSHCPPLVNLQLVYATATGIKRRDQRDRFAVAHPGPSANSAHLYCESLFPTASRRLSLVTSRRNPVAGRYKLEQWDTKPYRNHLLDRPLFSPDLEFDLTWYRGELFRVPSDGAITEDFTLRIVTPQAVTGIQLQCATARPSGFQDDEGGIWIHQVQDSIDTVPDGLNAGDFHTFTVTIFHGDREMDVKSFRARTYRVISGVTCYSPWRYWLAAEEDLPAFYDDNVNAILVNCGRDAVVCMIPFGIFSFEFNYFDNGPHPCPDEVEVNPVDVNKEVDPICPGGGFFAGGWQPFPPTWRQDWSVQVRSIQTLGWSDPDLDLDVFTMEGRVFRTWFSGNGATLSQQDQHPLQIPDPALDPPTQTDGFPGWSTAASLKEAPPIYPLPEVAEAVYFDVVDTGGDGEVIPSVSHRLGGTNCIAKYKEDA